MTARLTDVLVQSPHFAFAGAFDDPAYGFLYDVDIESARTEHGSFCRLLESLGVKVHELAADDHPSPDLVYTYDPALVTGRGAILLRSGKPSRRGEEDAMGGWFEAHAIPVIGRIRAPGTVDGGDVFWLQPNLVCVGRSLRTNQAGIEQLGQLLAEEMITFDLPYDRGPGECLHLLSVISPVSDDLAVVDTSLLPSGLWSLLQDLEIESVEVPAEEVRSLGCNVLAVAPGLAVMLEGNPLTRSRLEAREVEVHTFAGSQVCLNGSGGPTCLTRPLRREGASLP